MIFRIRAAPLGESTPLVLEELATWNHNYFVTQLAFDGEHLIVGDAISSICAVRWDEKKGRVESVARDYGPVWPVAVASTGTGAIVANVCAFSVSWCLWSPGDADAMIHRATATSSRSRCRRARNAPSSKRTVSTSSETS